MNVIQVALLVLLPYVLFRLLMRGGSGTGGSSATSDHEDAPSSDHDDPQFIEANEDMDEEYLNLLDPSVEDLEEGDVESDDGE